MINNDCDEEVFLLPLKKKDQKDRRCVTWKYESTKGCDCGCPPGSDAEEPRDAGCRFSDPRRIGGRFEDSDEWKKTKCTAAGLFRTLGRYYDETWFPTVINEWSDLYYRCNYSGNYWKYRDQWLTGDKEVRLEVWAEILRYRNKYDKRRQERCTEDEDAAKIEEICGSVDEANDVIDLKKLSAQDLNYNELDEPSAAERAKAETEAAEIAMADPDDDPDWVEMRRRMRGSFAALNRARCEVNNEMLRHVMVELCNYWSRVPKIQDEIEPLLENNILREIQNFRFKLFDVAAVIDPDSLPPNADRCRPGSETEECCEQAPPPEQPRPPPCPPAAKAKQRPKSATACARKPNTNKLTEARARQTAARLRDRENPTGRN